jgi:hypothetical protein
MSLITAGKSPDLILATNSSRRECWPMVVFGGTVAG